MARAVTGTRSIDQMVEAAIWLMVQGDRAGAEDLLAQVLRIDPTHERARHAMRSAGVTTRPGEKQPRDPALDRPTTQPGSPPDAGRTPLEPLPALSRPTPLPKTTFPHGVRTEEIVGGETMPGGPPMPFATTPSALAAMNERREERTDLSAAKEPAPITSTQPRYAMPAATTGRSWSLEVLNGPHAGSNLPVAKRSMLVGRGLGVIDVENDFFMAPGHASFFQRNGELWISDGGSASGTWLSVEGPTRLSPGDSFSVGLQRLRYLGPLDAAPAVAPWPYGAPRPASSWRLEHVLVGNRPLRTWVLRGVVTLGRDEATVRFPDDDSLAPVQAELRPAGVAIEVVDRSNAGSTFAMVPPGGERRLLEGMRVRLGSTIFRVTSR